MAAAGLGPEWLAVMDGTMNSENAESPEGECVKQRQKEKKKQRLCSGLV